MTEDQFYRGRRVVDTEWWLHDPDLPETSCWARLRVFDDGSADTFFGEGELLAGFASREDAVHFLCEDEYICFARMNAEDALEYGVDLAKLTPPDWTSTDRRRFEYVGTY